MSISAATALRPVADAIDDRIGEPRQRHPRRIDQSLLRVPFGGERLGQRSGRRGEDAAPRGAHRFAVELHGMTAGHGRGRRPGVETPPQRRPHGAAHRLSGAVGSVTIVPVGHRTLDPARELPWPAALTTCGVCRIGRAVTKLSTYPMICAAPLDAAPAVDRPIFASPRASSVNDQHYDKTLL